MRFTILYIIFLTLPIILTGQESSNSLLPAVQKYISTDHYNDALQLLESCTDTICIFTKADIYYRTGNYSQAKTIFEDLSTQNYKVLPCSRYLSKIYEAEGNVPKAVNHYLYLVKSDSTNAVYNRKLGSLYHKSGYTLESLAAYHKALFLNPKDIITITALSEMLFSLDQIAVADSIITIGHNLDSTNINVQLIRSRIAYKQKKYKEVTDILYGIKGRIDLDDYSSKILGFSLVKIDSFSKAIFTLHKVLLNDPEAESVHYYLGLAYEKIDQPDLASTHFNRALNAGISKQTSLYHRKIAKLASEKNDWPTTINHYKKSLDFKKNPEVFFLLARAMDTYYKDKSASVRYYKKYIASDHKNDQWKKYAVERRKYLQEIAFLKKN